MKVERISPNKIKVTLTMEDLRAWDIDVTALGYNSPETQELFWNMIKIAEKEVDFYVDGSQLVVEAMPPRRGDIIMIITKLDDDAAQFAKMQRFIRSRRKVAEMRAKVKAQPRTVRNPVCYEFERVDDLMDGVAAISKRFLGLSSIYELDGKFYLILEIASPLNGRDIEMIISDFAKAWEDVELILGLLNERANLIVKDNAVERLTGAGQ